MTPLVIESCDFVRIRLKAGQTTYFFKTAGALTGKKISAISIPTLGFLSGSLAMIDPSRVYITLIDIDGNIIFNNSPAILFSSASIEIIPIDRVIDWERSYIKVMEGGSVSIDTLSFFANVFTCPEGKPGIISGNEKYYTLPIEFSADSVTHIPLRNKLNALEGRKIKGAVMYMIPNLVSGYISLYPYDRSRFIERLELSNLVVWAVPVFNSSILEIDMNRRCIHTYFDPVEIDFDRSEIEIMPNIESETTNAEITFIYE